MSKIVLCETQEAPIPYKIEKINESFSSYEEFCYLIDQYLMLFLTEGIPFGMRIYLKEELGIQLKNYDIVEQLKYIINFRDYFTVDEKHQLQQRIRTAYLYSAAKKQKLLGDLLLSKHLYLGAVTAYKTVEKVSGQFHGKEKADIFYHMGLCQSRIFCFEDAKKSFQKSLSIKEQKEVQEAYFMVSYLQGDYPMFLEDGRKISFSEDQCRLIYNNIKQREDEIKNQEEFVKLKKIDYHRRKADDVMARRLTKAILEKWKDEYKKEII